MNRSINIYKGSNNKKIVVVRKQTIPPLMTMGIEYNENDYDFETIKEKQYIERLFNKNR